MLFPFQSYQLHCVICEQESQATTNKTQYKRMKPYYNIIINIRVVNLNEMKWFRVHTQMGPCIKKIPINIIMLVLVDVYKYLKIVHAQVKMLLVCANTFNAKNIFYLNLRPHNPQYLWAYKPNIGKMYQGWVFHHVNGSLHSSSLTSWSWNGLVILLPLIVLYHHHFPRHHITNLQIGNFGM